jgi:hypothetical protein
MTERSPIPACLSHLTQRDAAVIARALEEADVHHPREPTEAMIDAIHSVHRPGFAVTWYKVWTTMYDAWDRERRALIPTPPAPAPDDAPSHPPPTTAIRAIIERAAQRIVAGSSHAFIMVRAAEAEAAEQEIAAIERESQR